MTNFLKANLKNIKHEIYRGFNSDHTQLKKFQNKYEFEIIIGNYKVKTATTKTEVIESLKLRHDVFYGELLSSQHPTGLDIDRYDAFYDHIVVIDQKSNQVIATYRVQSSLISQDLYSKSEFDLRHLKLDKTVFLEIGRACVHAHFRKTTVLNCLWRGVAEYVKISKTEFLIGCGSIKTEAPKEVAKLCQYFIKNKLVNEQYDCPPLESFKIETLDAELQKIQHQNWTTEDDKLISKLIPPLFKSYIKAGAKVSTIPAWDKDFKCVDYLIFLNTSEIKSNYENRYL